MGGVVAATTRPRRRTPPDDRQPLRHGAQRRQVRRAAGHFVPMACVRELQPRWQAPALRHRVVAFAEEEGQRYKATFLGSGALIGHFNPAWLTRRYQRRDHARGHAARGPAPGRHCLLQRDPAQYLGFIEVHIEQGPVLNELDLPLGVVTSINGACATSAK